MECGDYQYNAVLEDMFKKCLECEDASVLAFGKLQEWEPAQSVLRLLKSFAEHAKTKPDEENIFELFKLKSSSIIGLRGLLNLGWYLQKVFTYRV